MRYTGLARRGVREYISNGGMMWQIPMKGKDGKQSHDNNVGSNDVNFTNMHDMRTTQIMLNRDGEKNGTRTTYNNNMNASGMHDMTTIHIMKDAEEKYMRMTTHTAQEH